VHCGESKRDALRSDYEDALHIAGTWIDEMLSNDILQMSIHDKDPYDVPFYKKYLERKRENAPKAEMTEEDAEELIRLTNTFMSDDDGQKIGKLTTDR
jgi:hypothetical protein